MACFLCVFGGICYIWSCIFHFIFSYTLILKLPTHFLFSGARELARDARASEPDDLVNSMIGGIASGALLGRLQGYFSLPLEVPLAA